MATDRFAAFEAVLRDVGLLAGLATGNYAIATFKLASLFPPLPAGRRFLANRLKSRPVDPPAEGCRAFLESSGLSPRKADVAELPVTGLSHKEIGQRLSIPPETAKQHAYNAYRKLKVQNRVQLMYVVRHGSGAGA